MEEVKNAVENWEATFKYNMMDPLPPMPLNPMSGRPRRTEDLRTSFALWVPLTKFPDMVFVRPLRAPPLRLYAWTTNDRGLCVLDADSDGLPRAGPLAFELVDDMASLDPPRYWWYVVCCEPTAERQELSFIRLDAHAAQRLLLVGFGVAQVVSLLAFSGPSRHAVVSPDPDLWPNHRHASLLL